MTLKELQKSVLELKEQQKSMTEDVVKIKESVLSKRNDKELIEVDKFYYYLRNYIILRSIPNINKL